MKTITVETELNEKQKRWLIENSSGKSKNLVIEEFKAQFKMSISGTLARRVYNRSKEPEIVEREPNQPLNAEERQWILSNYKSGQKEFGIAYMTKKFQVRREVIERLIQSNDRFKGKRVDPSKYVLTFGKHKGKSLSEVPLDYLQWMQRTINLSEWLHTNLERELELRAGTPKESPYDDSSTHYNWTDRNGEVHSIPNDVSLVGKENESAPF